MTNKIIKVDPRVHLNELHKIELNILAKIKELEREIKLKLIELQTTRDLIEEVNNNVEEAEVEEFTLASENLSKNIEKLEHVVEKFEVDKKAMNIEDQPYLLNRENLTLVTSYDTIDRLYDLATKTKWTSEEAQEFVGIKYNLNKAFQADFNPIISNRLEKVYSAMKTVMDKKPETNKYEFRNNLENFVTNNKTNSIINYAKTEKKYQK